MGYMSVKIIWGNLWYFNWFFAEKCFSAYLLDATYGVKADFLAILCSGSLAYIHELVY